MNAKKKVTKKKTTPQKKKSASEKVVDKPKKEEIKEITLEYHLHELPSSQHKAGLAGLYLIIDWLNEQDINKELIQKTEITETSLKVTLTKKDITDLFNEIYKPIPITIESDKIRKKGKGEDKKDNPPINQYLKKIKTEVYIYESKPKSKKEEGKVLIREIEKPGKLGKLSKQYI